MGILTADEIAAQQDWVTADLLPDTATIHTKTYTVTPSGGRTMTLGPVLDTYPCRVGSRRTQQQGQGGALVAVTEPVITLPAGASVTTAQAIKVAGITYEVITVEDRGAWEIARRVVCRKSGG